MTETMTEEKIKQPRGETVEFKGELIASTEFETKKQPPTTIALEIWRTEGGALIAVTDEGRADGQGFADVRVAVIEAKDYITAAAPVMLAALEAFIAERDRGGAMGMLEAEALFRAAIAAARGPELDARVVQEMRWAVMRHFNWEARARDMVRKQLPEWDLVRRVA